MSWEAKEYLLTVIEASNPCLLRSVIADCERQGYTKNFIPALYALLVAGIITIDDSDDELVVELN